QFAADLAKAGMRLRRSRYRFAFLDYSLTPISQLEHLRQFQTFSQSSPIPRRNKHYLTTSTLVGEVPPMPSYVQWTLVGLYVLAAAYVHLRGRYRFRLLRQLTDHSTLLAPLNVIFYLSSKVRAKPYADVKEFPQLAKLTENWQIIRDECL